MTKPITRIFFYTLFFGTIICFFTSCDKNFYITYTNYSRSYIKKDTATQIYYGYNEDLGLNIPFFNIDTIYGNKRKARIVASIFEMKPHNQIICVYSCSKINSIRKGYAISKKLGCADKTGQIKFKVKYDSDTITFISKPISADRNKALVYQLMNVARIR